MKSSDSFTTEIRGKGEESRQASISELKDARQIDRNPVKIKETKKREKNIEKEKRI